MRNKLFLIFNRKEDVWYCYSDVRCSECVFASVCPRKIKPRPWSLRPKGEL